ncbi:unnamed protein product [Urochloa humidicola]
MDTVGDGEFSDASSDDECYDCSDDDDRDGGDDDDEHEAVAANLALTVTEAEISQLFQRHLVVAEKRKSHVALTQQEIHQRLGQEVAATAEVLCVPPDWALALLVHHGWDLLRLHEEWFAGHQDRILHAAGLGDAAAGPGDEIATCGICDEATPAAETSSAGCDHRYCHGCWRRYVAAALEDGGHGSVPPVRVPARRDRRRAGAAAGARTERGGAGGDRGGVS